VLTGFDPHPAPPPETAFNNSVSITETRLSLPY
jgi:hypothetical protein